MKNITQTEYRGFVEPHLLTLCNEVISRAKIPPQHETKALWKIREQVVTWHSH